MPRSIQLHLTLFLAGAVALCLEFACPRLLAPVYGSGHYVWSSVVTMTLVAFAVGYWRGGLAADAAGTHGTLVTVLACAGAWLVGVYLLRADLVLWLVELGLPLAPLGTAALMIFVPIALLASVYPITVRLLSDRVEAVGRTVGRASGISTLGSVVGSLGTAFLLIPRFATGAILLGCAVALVGTAAMLLASRRPRASASLAAGALAVVGLGMASESAAAGGVVYFTNSVYSTIAVHEDPRRNLRVLLLDGVAHGAVELPSLKSPGQTLKALELALFMRPVERALVIGLGAGVLPRLFTSEYGIETDTVELDPEVHRVAMSHFGFPSSQRVEIGDGRRFLDRNRETYDLIVLDAAAGDSHPFHLYTSEAFALYRDRLSPSGILAINLIASEDNEEGLLCANSILRTLELHFAHVAVLESELVRSGESRWDIFAVFASEAPLEYRADPSTGRPEIARYYELIRSRPFQSRLGTGPAAELGIVLTDDYSPLDHWSERLLMADRSDRLGRMTGR